MKKVKKMTVLVLGTVLTAMLLAGCSLIKDKNGNRNDRDMSGQCGDNLTYEYKAKTGKLTIKGSGEMTSCPWSGYDGVTVKSVEFEEGITSIYNGAFYAQNELTGDIVLPSTLTYIDEFAFYGTEKLGSVTFSENTTFLGDYAFRQSGIKGQLILPDSITYIGVECFDTCTNLTGALKLPASLEKIGRVAFTRCEGFTGDLVIPDSVTEIGAYAFSECKGLNGNLTLSSKLTAIESDAFKYCGFVGDLIIPEGVTLVDDNAFLGCSFDGKLELPSTLTDIGYSAFSKNLFKGEIIIPSGVGTIESEAFYDCKELTSVVFNEGLKYICNEAFRNCEGLTELNLPQGLIGIGGAAFMGCKGLSGSLNIPDSVTIISEGAFFGCAGLSGTLIIPEGVTEICEDAFASCSGFTGTLVIPESVKYIGTRAFKGCSDITKAVIGQKVTSIGGGVFTDCSSLKEVEFTNTQWIPDYYTEKVDYDNTFTFDEGCKLTIPSTAISVWDNWNNIQSEVKAAVEKGSFQSERKATESREEPYYWTQAIGYDDFVGTGSTADTVVRFEDGTLYIAINGKDAFKYSYSADSLSDDYSIVTDKLWYKDGFLSDLCYYRGYNCDIVKGLMTHADGSVEDIYFYKNTYFYKGTIYLEISIEMNLLEEESPDNMGYIEEEGVINLD